MFTKLMLIACLLFGIFSHNLTSAQNVGLGAYAALHPKWPCKQMMRAYKGIPTLRMSVLWHTFGRNFSCLDTWASDPRPKFLQVHLINEVCHRNKRCGNYELLKSLSLSDYRNKLKQNDELLYASIRENVRPMAEWLAAHENVQCSLTAGLESNLDSGSYQNLVRAIRDLFPSRCSWGWNPVENNKYGKPYIPGFIYELHGATPHLNAPCITNMDGVDSDLPARPAVVTPKIAYSDLPLFLASSASCDAAFLWIGEFNGIKSGGFIDPRKRTNWPTHHMFDQLNKQMTKKVEGVPSWDAEAEKGKAGCKTFLKVPDGAKKDFLWKQSEPAVNGRGAVTFLPRTYNKTKINLKNIYVMQGSKKIASAYERGIYSEDGSNRQFWRFRKPAADFPYNVVVHYGNVCAVVPNPKIRVD